MANVYDKLKEMNITLPAPPPKGGVYTPVMEFGDHLLYCSGCGPDIGDGHNIVGKVGGDLTLEQGQKAAYNCMLNLLANLDAKLGDLNRIKRCVKVLGFVNCTDDFCTAAAGHQRRLQPAVRAVRRGEGSARPHRHGHQFLPGQHRGRDRDAGGV